MKNVKDNLLKALFLIVMTLFIALAVLPANSVKAASAGFATVENEVEEAEETNTDESNGLMIVVLGGGLLIIISVVVTVVTSTVSSVASIVEDDE